MSGIAEMTGSAFSFAALLETLAGLETPFRRQDEDVALRDRHGNLAPEIMDAVRVHKAALLALCDCRAELGRLHEYIIKSRIGDSAKVTRAGALAYIADQIERLAEQSERIGGTAAGWPDPADSFADRDQITGLRAGFAELTAEGNPYPLPLPEGCVLLPEPNFDPFEHGRLYNGRVSLVGPSSASAAEAP